MTATTLSKSDNGIQIPIPLETLENEKKKAQDTLLRAILGEALGTFLFIFSVEAIGVNASISKSATSPLVGAVGAALASTAIIYSFADVSGAHLNPAVTFATMVTKKTSLLQGLCYIFAQLVASVLANSFLMLVLPSALFTNQLQKNAVDAAIVVTDSNGYFKQFFLEFITSFILIYVIFATAFDTIDTKFDIKIDDDKHVTKEKKKAGKNLTIYPTTGQNKAGFAPLSIGLTIGFLCFFGAAFNPARVLGPVIISNSGSRWVRHELFWIASLLGAATGGFFQSVFDHRDSKPVVLANVN